MEVAGYYINPYHVAAVSAVRKSGPSAWSFTVFLSGVAEAIKPAFGSEAEAAKERGSLLTAVGFAHEQ